MKYLLDSNIISEGSKPSPNSRVVELLNVRGVESALSSVTAFELLYGVNVLPAGTRKDRLQAYLDETVFPFYNVLAYDFKCSEIHADVMAKLKSVGQMVPYQDSQIASVALANGLILVTRNVKDFEPVAQYFPLKIENWFEYSVR